MMDPVTEWFEKIHREAGPQTGNVFVLISSVGVQRRDDFILVQKARGRPDR